LIEVEVFGGFSPRVH